MKKRKIPTIHDFLSQQTEQEKRSNENEKAITKTVTQQSREDTGNKPVQANQAQHKADLFHQNLLKTVADNIRRGELLKVELYKGLQAKRPLEELFPLALECIGRMTDDKYFLEETGRMIERYHQSN